ncbi:MAG: sugar phosphate isomerase/epimerase [Planctomycetes bacterium]|nr:sugar phosphate isomerase/epimerase [Planctomycetota bacterium]
MKFGTYYAYWEQEWKADYLHYIDKVAKLGFDILEVGAHDISQMSDDEIKRIKDAAAAAGITMTAGIGMPADCDISSDDAQIVENGMNRLKGGIVAMEKLGVPIIGGIIYSYWPCDYTRPVDKPGVRARAVAGTKKIADFAADHNVVLGIEIVNRFEHFLLNTSEEGVAFVKEVDKKNVVVMLDCFHMNIEEDFMGDAIRTAGPLLGHFHIGECNRKVPGKGHMPWDDMGKALRDINYTGAVVMEPFVKPGGTVGKEIKVWRDLSNGASVEQMDKDIAESLVFVREKFLGK